MKIVQFLIAFDNYIFLAMFALLTLVSLVNFIYNPYGCQNVKFAKFCRHIAEKPSTLREKIKLLPKEYQRQWRAYVNSGAQKPSTVFEFVKKPFKYKLWLLHLLTILLCLFYIVVGFVLVSKPHVLPVQVAFLLAGALVIILSKLIDNVNLAQARKNFGKFVKTVTMVVEINDGTKTAITQGDNAKPIDTPSVTPQSAVDKAVQALRQKGLENPRTVEEQRKLNIALNNLLQACSKKSV